MKTITLMVNGRKAHATVEDRMLLVDLLRGPLALTGTHVGCDTTQCGACTVHVDGLAVKSCTMFAAEANGADVITIEGIEGPDGRLSPLQKAFQDHHGLQCGYCTPGMIMSLTALLAETPKPTEAEIRHHLEGNICRCTGYANIVQAALAASGQLPATATTAS